jgi:enoyl-CoA hydratase
MTDSHFPDPSQSSQEQSMEDVLLIDRRESFAIVTMNRPAALNALSRPLVRALIVMIDELEADPTVRGLILTGAGRAFCAGMDLKELQDANGPLAQEGGLWAGEALNPVTYFNNFKGPTIAAVNGAAITGGFEMALCCDIIIASTNARFADTHARVGIVPGGGVSQYLSRSLGIHRARELHLTGNFLSAEQADRWGLVNRVVPPEELMPAAEALMRDMLELDDTMSRTYKKLINEGFGLPFAAGLALEETTARAEAERSTTGDIADRTAGIIARGRNQTPS